MSEENKKNQPLSLINNSTDPNIGNVKDRDLSVEMKKSYLDYAMSVIVARALPDVRDGMKPVHRRVLFSMHELGLRSNVKFRKSATVVGDVLGKYHPHGDVAVYDTMVRMAQNFSLRYRLVDGQGNFGSMDGDGAAAMRYTEARMTSISEEMLSDIEKDTVDFAPNYDGSRSEPKVLPAKIPQLLLNGTLGIAVGMASNIPPHNLGELIDGSVALISNPDITTQELMDYVKGPDFPTGGIVFGSDAVKSAYGTGRGKIILRGVATIEENKNNKFRIIVSQIPYQVNKAELIAKIAEMVKLKKIEGISDLRDESDRKSGVRIVIELKQNTYPKKILNKLYQITNLQIAYHFNMVALLDGIQPKTMTLKDMLSEFISHRQEVVTRRTRFDLNKAKDRAHILEGLKKALDHIDEIIKTIKSSSDKNIAHRNLMNNFGLSDKQSTAILEMKLSTLSGLERKKITDELNEKINLIKELTSILQSPQKILDIIKNELIEIKDKYNDERKTKIMPGGIEEFKIEDLVPNEQVIITLTKDNYIKRVPVSTYRIQNRGGKGKSGMSTKEKDIVRQLMVAMTHDSILFFTDKGRVFKNKVYDIPAASRIAKGQALVNFLQLAPDEKVSTVLCVNKTLKNKRFLFMTTKLGIVKKTTIDKFENIRQSGLIAINLKEGDNLKWILPISENQHVLMITKKGQSIHFNESDVRPMGRAASGVRGIKLREGDVLISASIIDNESAEIFTITEMGYGKRTSIKEFTLQKRGGIGLRAAKITSKTGNLVSATSIYNLENDLVVISNKGIVLRTQMKSVKKLGRDTQGVRIIKINQSDMVASMTVFEKSNNSNSKKSTSNTFNKSNNIKLQLDNK
jgi:DNA gyrase subunit A